MSCDLKRRSSDTGDRHEICAQSIEAADHAVKKVFAILGVDIEKPESVEEFREDLRFGKRMRKAADHGQLVLVGVMIVGLFGLFVAGVVSKLKGG